MHRTLHSSLALFFAVWLPFCCCQVRAAAGAIVHGATGKTTVRAHACCEGCNAGDAGPDAPDGDALHGASSTRKPGEPAKTADTGCCVSCKDRVLPAELSVPLGDTIGADILVATALLLDIVEARAQLGVWTHFGTGPPGAPSGRTILAQAGILLV